MDRLFRSITKKREDQQVFRDELVKLWAVAFTEARISLAPRARALRAKGPKRAIKPVAAKQR
jgi:hypothetical protein